MVPSSAPRLTATTVTASTSGLLQGKVIEADAGRAFAFECSMMEFHYSTWGYRINPTESGSRVTEWSEDLRPESVMEFSRQTSGVDDRTEQNRQD